MKLGMHLPQMGRLMGAFPSRRKADPMATLDQFSEQVLPAFR